MMETQKFRTLKIWQNAMELSEHIYKISNLFPKSEVYGLTIQIKRAVISVALNIAEGSAAGTDAEFKRFLNIAHRSNYEVMCGLELANRLGFLGKKSPKFYWQSVVNYQRC